jgi:hypothetical protein
MKARCYGMESSYVINFSYPVKKEVGKVGENSPLFIVPLDSAENKSNIANFFSKPTSPTKPKQLIEEAIDKNASEGISAETRGLGKRKIEEVAEQIEIKEEGSPPPKVKVVEDKITGQSPVKTPQRKPTKRTPQSAKKSPIKKEAGPKITSFFAVK